jgi:hypothetical protein
VRYEDLAADPQAELGRIAASMEITASAEQISKAVQDSEFTTLVVREALEGFAVAPSVHRSFFRKGTVDSWVDELDAALVDQIVADHGEVMREFNYLD